MSGNGYGYYYASSAQNFPVVSPDASSYNQLRGSFQDPNPSWSDWSLEQQQYNNIRGAVSHHNSVNHANNSYGQLARSQPFYNANSRPYQQRRFNGSQPYSGGGQQQNWQRNNYGKRPRPLDSPNDCGEARAKNAKKKKKPLSQNIPSKKDWTLEEAEMALSVEKEFNKRYKNHSLIIKFPDLELNRDIVTKFHPSIESVHFQQPSTPRFCFVTLQETADADAVIGALNKIKFGAGFLTAEFKKDREEDQNIGPEDIDPCTLYVGNLAQEITKEDMVKTYPKGRRIDIGYAKKMKYTRYAFVSFKNVTDSVEAFKKTHSTQMYSKSLIVRFRRLHGTVGMPGESKPQSPAKNKNDTASTSDKTGQTSATKSNEVEEKDKVAEVDLSVVKQEVDSSDDDGAVLPKDYESPFMPGSINLALEQHRPMIKKEIKQEADKAPVEVLPSANTTSSSGFVQHASAPQVQVKQEDDKDQQSDDDDSSSDDENGGFADVNFRNLLNELEDHSNQIESLRKLIP